MFKSKYIQRIRYLTNRWRTRPLPPGNKHNQWLSKLNLKEEDTFNYIEACLTEDSANFIITLSSNLNGVPGIYYHNPDRTKHFIEISRNQNDREKVISLFHEILHSHPKFSTKSVKGISTILDTYRLTEALIEPISQRAYRDRPNLVKIAEDQLNRIESSTPL